MIDRVSLLPGADANAARGELRILDSGTQPVSAAMCAAAVQQVRDGRALIVGVDRNATCYQVPWTTGDEAPDCAIVKGIRTGSQRTNPDTTFSGESAILAQLPAAGITNAPRLLARVRDGGDHFLLMTRVSGAHPDPRVSPLRDEELAAIIDCLFRMDGLGLNHYDLKPANILLDGDRVNLVDFEFSRFEAWQDAFATAKSTYCDDFNVSGNPHFPARTNVANFEFRTLSRYCQALRDEGAAPVADALLQRYLAHRARYHARRADWLLGFRAPCVADIARLGGIGIGAAASRLAAAAAFERMQAGLLREGDRDVVAAEAALIALRRQVFEHDDAGARESRLALSARVARFAERDAVRGPRYRMAVAATASSVLRSWHPGADATASAGG